MSKRFLCIIPVGVEDSQEKPLTYVRGSVGLWRCLLEGADNFLAEELRRVVDQLGRHGSDLVIAGEQVQPHAVLHVLKSPGHGVRTADDREPVLNAELV